MTNILDIMILSYVIFNRWVALSTGPILLKMPKFEQIDHGIDEKRKDIVLNIGNPAWKS